MPDNPLADEVWHTMAEVVFDHRDNWRRAVTGSTGLPLSRVRILRRLSKTSMTAKQLAAAVFMDAPATTVAVNDLEDRGLVVRQTDPANRRCKLVSLTEQGRAVVGRIERTGDPAPESLAALTEQDLRALKDILGKL